MKRKIEAGKRVKRRVARAVAAALLAGGGSLTARAEPSLAELDQKVRILERKLELSEEAQQAKAKESPAITADAKDGFSLSSADKAFQLKLKGYVQADGRFLLDDNAKAVADAFLIRRARLIFDGTLARDFEFRIAPDFGNGTAQLQDGYLDYKASPLANLRVGRTKVPLGLERLQSSADTVFSETGLPTALTPNYDSGVLLYGSAATGVLDYAVGVFNGGGDGASVDTDTNDGKDLAGRIFLTPFKNTDATLVKGLSFGVAGTVGDQDGTTSAPGLPSVKSSGQQTIFAYKSSTNTADTAYAKGARTRLAPQLFYTVGSAGVLAEYVSSEQDVARGKTTTTVKNDGWQVVGSYVLTGEAPSLKGVKPFNAFDPAKGNWGAFELAARLSELDLDEAAFKGGLADSKKSVTKAQAIGGALNWYLTRNAKASLDYEVTSFTGGASKGDRPDEKLLLARLQYAF